MYVGGRIAFEYDPERQWARILMGSGKEGRDIRNWRQHLKRKTV